MCQRIVNPHETDVRCAEKISITITTIGSKRNILLRFALEKRPIWPRQISLSVCDGVFLFFVLF